MTQVVATTLALKDAIEIPEADWAVILVLIP
jgi:hypothetical protein